MTALWNSFVWLNKEVVERIVWSFCDDIDVFRMITLNRSTHTSLNMFNYPLKWYLYTGDWWNLIPPNQRYKLKIRALILDNVINNIEIANELEKLLYVEHLKITEDCNYMIWRYPLKSLDLSEANLKLAVIIFNHVKDYNLKQLILPHQIYYNIVSLDIPSLRVLDVGGLVIRSKGVIFPSGLKKLIFRGNYNSLIRIAIPSHLTELDLGHKYIYEIPSLPSSLLKLRINIYCLTYKLSTIRNLKYLKVLTIIENVLVRYPYHIDQFPLSLTNIIYEKNNDKILVFNGLYCRQKCILEIYRPFHLLPENIKETYRARSLF